jgi:uncharacterized protein YrrD
MRLDDLRNLVVIDPDTACLVGAVTGYWIDAAGGRVGAITIRPVDVDLPQRFSSDRVARVGTDAVMLTRANGAMAPVAAPVSDGWLDRHHMSSLVVYTDVGERLGRVAGAHIDAETLTIESYDLAVPLWRRWLPGRKSVTADCVAWCGRDVLVVRTDEPVKLRPVGREDGSLPIDLAGAASNEGEVILRDLTDRTGA